MRILKINNTIVDIDDKTAIGITFQKYDIKEPGNRKVNVSNSFTLPKTIKNLKLFGFADNPQNIGLEIYSKFRVDYWIDTEKLIDNGSLRVDEISDRIKVFVVEKDSFWDELEKYTWQEFCVDFAVWLQAEKNYPFSTSEGTTYYTGTFGLFIAGYEDSTEGLLFSYYFGKYLDYVDGETWQLEQDLNIYANGGHLCVYEKTIFEFLEYKFSVNLNLSDTDTLNIWNDTYAPKLYIPIRNFIIGNYLTTDNWFFVNFPLYEENPIERPDKTMYDYVRSFIHTLNLVIIDEYIDDVYSIKFYRFDDIKDKAEVVPFSSKLVLDKIKFKPSIDGFAQVNYIKYGTKYEGASDYEGDKYIQCKNENIDPVKNLFEIDSYYPNVVENSESDAVVNLPDASYDTFVHLITDKTLTYLVEVFYTDVIRSSRYLQLAALYSIQGEYNFIEEIVEYPKFYEIQKWLTIYDVINIDFFKQYYIKELGASFFINKISGFNPDKSNAPTKIELIKVSDKAPLPIDVYENDFYSDGVGDAFIDGNGDYFI